MFDLPAYRTDSAARIWSQLDAPVHMLRLGAQAVDSATQKVAVTHDIWTPAREGHHYVYTLHLQPALTPAEVRSTAGYGRMSVALTNADFAALHSMLQQVKQLHSMYLAGVLDDAAKYSLSGEGDGLCFSTIYSLHNGLVSRNPAGVNVQPYRALQAMCAGFEMFIHRGRETITCGTFSLFNTFAGMAGLILEAERIMALVEGLEERDIQALESVQLTRERRARLQLVQ